MSRKPLTTAAVLAALIVPAAAAAIPAPEAHSTRMHTTTTGGGLYLNFRCKVRPGMPPHIIVSSCREIQVDTQF